MPSDQQMASHKRTKLLFVGPCPPPYSGPELGMELFLRSSLAQTYDIVLLKTNVRKSSALRGRMDLQMISAFFRFVALLPWYVLRHRPALVYYPVTATQRGWLGRDVWCLFICRLLRVKTVVHLRAGHFRLNYAAFSGPAKWLVRRALATASVAIVQADCLKDQFRGLIPEEKIKRLYQAIDTARYDNPDLGDFVPHKVLFMGNLSNAKGYCDVVKIIEDVVERYPRAQFCFAGTMVKRNRNVLFNQVTGERLDFVDPFEVEAHVKTRPVTDHYHNLGVVAGEEKMRHLRECDIVVLPSYSEGFSRALVEAMSVGKPVVYTPVGAHREVMVDGVHGLMVHPGDRAGLCECICRLLGDRQLRDRIALANYRCVREQFDISIIATQLSTIFSACLDAEPAISNTPGMDPAETDPANAACP